MTTLARDTHGRAIKITRLSEEEIQVFDSKLGKIQTLVFPDDDLKVYDRICEVRDALFRLDSQIRGCDVAELCCGGSSGLDEAVYQKTLNDMFWNQAKQNAYDSEEDESLKEHEF
jgi:hypothetical protein